MSVDPLSPPLVAHVLGKRGTQFVLPGCRTRPYLHCAVGTAGENAPPIRAERHTQHAIGVTSDRLADLLGCCCDEVVPAATEAVGRGMNALRDALHPA